MSLTLLALRVAAVEALRGNTWAGDLVFDTGGEIPDSDENVPRFHIVVESGGMQHNHGALILTLSLIQREIIEDKVGDEIVPRLAWGTPLTTPAFEVALDCFATQVLRALTDSSNGWAKAFAGIAAGLQPRTASATGLANRVLVLDCECGHPPRDRASANEGWKAFLAELGGCDHEQRNAFHYMIGGGVDSPIVSNTAPNWDDFGIDVGVHLVPAEAAAEGPAAAPVAA